MDVEVQLTLLIGIGGVALERLLQNLVIELHLFERGAACFILADRVGEACLAIFAVVDQVIKRGDLSLILLEFGDVLPPKGFSFTKTVHLHAHLGLCLLERLAGVPAELVVLAFYVLIAFLIGGLLLRTTRVEGPRLLASTVEAIVAVLVLLTTVILLPTPAHLLFAVAGPTLEGVGAESTGQEILADANDLLALSGQLLVLEL